jgi:replicative DNA helicase
MSNVVAMTALSSKEKFIIDTAFEDKIIACMFRIGDFAAVAAAYLKPSYFGNPMRQNLAKMSIEFWQKYGALIKGRSLAHEVKTLVDKKIIQPKEANVYGNYILDLSKTDISDYKYVLEKLVEFIKNREYRQAIDDAVGKYLPKGDFERIEKLMAKVAAVSTKPSPKPYAYTDPANIEARAIQRERVAKIIRAGISTGIPEMDKTLSKGGWYRKELYIIMAPPKRGKTMGLLWFANFGAKQGFNVAFFTLETAIEILTDRLDAQNAMIETKMLVGNANHVRSILSTKKIPGEIFFFEYPTKTCTVAEIDRQVAKLERDTEKGVDMIVVDYGDLVKPAFRKENKLDEQADIFEDLRGLAGKYSVPILTATQINRSGTGKAVNDGTDVAGTYEKIMVADGVITFSAKNDELKEGKLRISFAESRNNERKTFLVKTNYAAGTFFKEFIKIE